MQELRAPFLRFWGILFYTEGITIFELIDTQFSFEQRRNKLEFITGLCTVVTLENILVYLNLALPINNVVKILKFLNKISDDIIFLDFSYV